MILNLIFTSYFNWKINHCYMIRINISTDNIFQQYRNECEMLKASCEMKSPLSFLHHGACTEAELKTKLQGKLDKNSDYFWYFLTLTIPYFVNSFLNEIFFILKISLEYFSHIFENTVYCWPYFSKLFFSHDINIFNYSKFVPWKKNFFYIFYLVYKKWAIPYIIYLDTVF